MNPFDDMQNNLVLAERMRDCLRCAGAGCQRAPEMFGRSTWATCHVVPRCMCWWMLRGAICSRSQEPGAAKACGQTCIGGARALTGYDAGRRALPTAWASFVLQRKLLS
jgi:hypothetical protein